MGQFIKQLQNNRESIILKWFDSMVADYPPNTSHFLKTQSDTFANPVGGTMSENLGLLLDQLIQAFPNKKALDPKKITKPLDALIRIRAVQDFTPARAVRFIFTLKSIVRQSSEEYDDQFETLVDQLGLAGFDIYMTCREKLYEIQATEMRKRTYNAVKRAGLIAEVA